MRALVAAHWPSEDTTSARPSALPGGAVLVAPGRTWALIDDGEVARFGAVLAWADRQGVERLDVLVDGSPSAPGVIARRAAAFPSPSVSVWSVDRTSLVPAQSSPHLEESAGPPPSLVAALDASGLEVVWEHGVLRGEVLGLEVARTVGDDLVVGVGRHDRDARAAMRPDEPLDAALASTAAAVRDLRRTGAPSHPANRLARGRWLRSLAVASPSTLGLAGLEAVAPPLPWFDLPEAGAAPAVGTIAGSTAPVVVVFSAGVDLDLVPTAADARALHGPSADLWLVMPEGDDLAVTRSLAARLDPPATVKVVERGWEERLRLKQVRAMGGT